MNPYVLGMPENSEERSRLKVVDLFSGVGGISLGFSNAGFDVRLGMDLDGACAKTHRRNFPQTPFIHADIRDVSASEILEKADIRPGELDVLVGGPPCQGFSIIGKRKILDPRNSLIREFMRIARELRPKVLMIENVPGLATLERGAVLAEIAESFRSAGYSIDCAELLAAQYGVPQMRWRMFFVGWRNDLKASGGFPAPTHGVAGIGDLVPNRAIPFEMTTGFVTIREAIGDLPVVGAGEINPDYCGPASGKYQQAMRKGAPSQLANHYAPRLAPQNIERIRMLAPGEDWRALPFEMLPAGMQRAHRKDHTRRFRRMQWEGVARAIITRFRDPKSGEYIHPEQDRTISIREAARIQSFPDWFVFEGSNSEQYDQVGNAVPPLLAKAVALEIRSMLASDGLNRREPVKCRYRLPVPSEFIQAAE